MGAPAVGQAFGVHPFFHVAVHLVGIEPPLGIEPGHLGTFGRRVGVQREVNQLDVDVVVFAKFFNTHGTEVTPRSNVVAEQLQRDGLGHINLHFFPRDSMP